MNNLAKAVASVKAELIVSGQWEDTPGGEAEDNAGVAVPAGALGPQQGASMLAV